MSLDFQSHLTDPWWRLNNLYKIKNKAGEVVTLKWNWAQKELYNGLWYLNLVLKARQLGITTAWQIFMLDRCLFNDNINAGVVAHTAEDAAAFFDDKIKFAYDSLPNDLRMMREATSDSKRHLRFSNGSQLRVGTSLRSGTYQYVHVSEFGKMCAKFPEKAAEVVSGTLNTVAPGQFILIESTAEGPFGEFYEMCKAAETLTKAVEAGRTRLSQLDYKFFFYPWWKHPDYTLREPCEIPDKRAEYFKKLREKDGITLTLEQKYWYVKKRAEQQDKMKQEYPATPKEAFERSTELAIFGEQMTKARDQGRIGSLPIARGHPVHTFWDLGRNDLNAIWFMQHVGAQYRFVYYYQYRLVDLTYYVEKLHEFKESFKWFYGHHYMPHDVEVTDMSSFGNRTRRRVLEDAGLNGIIVVPRIRHINDAIELARNVFDECYFDEEGCEEGLKALDGYEWVWDEHHKTTRNTPAHNWASNGASAFQQFAQGYNGSSATFKEQSDKLAGGRGRRHTRGQSRRGTLINPDTDHVR